MFSSTVITTIDVMSNRVCMAGGQKGEVFRSEDGGRTWLSLPTFTPKPTAITDFYAPPTGQWLCAALSLYESADSGRTWQPHQQFSGVATTATRIGVIDVPGTTSIGVAGIGLAISTDNGTTFRAPMNSARCHDVTCANNGVFYSAIERNAEVYRIDKRQWTSLNYTTNRFFHSSLDSVYALTQSTGIHVFREPRNWYSNDYGTWDARSGDLNHTSVLSCWTLMDDQILVREGSGGLHRLQRNGSTYTDTLSYSPGLFIRSLSQSASGRIVASASSGSSLDIYFSNDGGRSFVSSFYFSAYDQRYDKKPAPKDYVCYHPTKDTLMAAVIDHILMDVTIGTTIQFNEAGTIATTYSMVHGGDFVLAQTDRAIIKHAVGSDEQRPTLQGDFSTLAPMVRTDQGVIYVVGTTSLFRSIDDGEHWTSLELPPLRHRPLNCVTGPRGLVAISSDTDVAITLDSGRTWQNYASGLPDATITSIAVDKNAQLVVGTDGYSLLVRSIDLTTSVEESSEGEGRRLKEEGQAITLSVFPNPTSDQFTATVHVKQRTTLVWSMTSVTGGVVSTWTSEHNEGTSTVPCIVPAGVGTGMYTVTCTADGRTRSVPLLYLK